MKPVFFEKANAVYIDNDGGKDIPVLAEWHDQWKQETNTSVWKPNDDDLRILNNGGSICLRCFGSQQAVVVYADNVKTIEARINHTPSITVKTPDSLKPDNIKSYGDK